MSARRCPKCGADSTVVDSRERLTGVNIWIRFEQNEIPTIEITQTHYMNGVLALMRREEA